MRTILSLLSLTALGLAQGGIPWWTGSFDEGLEEARRRNVPVLVAFIQDGEEANERIVSGLHRSAGFLKLTRKVIPIIASVTIHPQTTATVRGRKRKVCSRFGRMPCQVHKDQELAAREAFWGEDTPVKTPSHIVALPDKTEIGRLIDVHPAQAVDQLVQKAQKKLGRGLSREEYSRARAWLARAPDRVKKDEIEALLQEREEMLRTVAGTPLAKELEQVMARIEHHGQRLVGKASDLAAAKQEGEALRIVVGQWKRYKGTDAGKVMRSLENKLRRTKAGRAVIQELAREKRVRPWYEKAAVALGERRYGDAYRDYRRVFEAAPASRLGREALAEIEDLVQDPDIGPLLATRRKKEAATALKKARTLMARSPKRGRKQLGMIVKLYAGMPEATEAAKLLEK